MTRPGRQRLRFPLRQLLHRTVPGDCPLPCESRVFRGEWATAYWCFSSQVRRAWLRIGPADSDFGVFAPDFAAPQFHDDERRNRGLALPCTFEAETPWLRLGQSAGVTPVEIPLEADASGLPTGEHPGVIRIRCGTFESTVLLGLRIGPLLQFEPTGEIEAVVNRPVTHRLQINSSSSAFEYSVEASESWVHVDPGSGRTPGAIEVTTTLPATIGSQQVLPGVRVYPRLTVRYGGLTTTIPLSYRAITPGSPPAPADSISPRAVAPGSLIAYIAYGADCDSATLAGSLWPDTLGGCRLRLNGRTLPLGEIVRQSVPGAAAFGSLPQGRDCGANPLRCAGGYMGARTGGSNGSAAAFAGGAADGRSDCARDSGCGCRHGAAAAARAGAVLHDPSFWPGQSCRRRTMGHFAGRQCLAGSSGARFRRGEAGATVERGVVADGGRRV